MEKKKQLSFHLGSRRFLHQERGFLFDVFAFLLDCVGASRRGVVAPRFLRHVYKASRTFYSSLLSYQRFRYFGFSVLLWLFSVELGVTSPFSSVLCPQMGFLTRQFVVSCFRVWKVLFSVIGNRGLVGWRRLAVIGFSNKARIVTRYNYRKRTQYIWRRTQRKWRLFVAQKHPRFFFKRYKKLRRWRYELSFNFAWRCDVRLPRLALRKSLRNARGFLQSFLLWRCKILQKNYRFYSSFSMPRKTLSRSRFFQFRFIRALRLFRLRNRHPAISLEDGRQLFIHKTTNLLKFSRQPTLTHQRRFFAGFTNPKRRFLALRKFSRLFFRCSSRAKRKRWRRLLAFRARRPQGRVLRVKRKAVKKRRVKVKSRIVIRQTSKKKSRRGRSGRLRKRLFLFLKKRRRWLRFSRKFLIRKRRHRLRRTRPRFRRLRRGRRRSRLRFSQKNRKIGRRWRRRLKRFTFRYSRALTHLQSRIRSGQKGRHRQIFVNSGKIVALAPRLISRVLQQTAHFQQHIGFSQMAEQTTILRQHQVKAFQRSFIARHRNWREEEDPSHHPLTSYFHQKVFGGFLRLRRWQRCLFTPGTSFAYYKERTLLMGKTLIKRDLYSTTAFRFSRSCVVTPLGGNLASAAQRRQKLRFLRHLKRRYKTRRRRKPLRGSKKVLTAVYYRLASRRRLARRWRSSRRRRLRAFARPLKPWRRRSRGLVLFRLRRLFFMRGRRRLKLHHLYRRSRLAGRFYFLRIIRNSRAVSLFRRASHGRQANRYTYPKKVFTKRRINLRIVKRIRRRGKRKLKRFFLRFLKFRFSFRFRYCLPKKGQAVNDSVMRFHVRRRQRSMLLRVLKNQTRARKQQRFSALVRVRFRRAFFTTLQMQLSGYLSSSPTGKEAQPRVDPVLQGFFAYYRRLGVSRVRAPAFRVFENRGTHLLMRAPDFRLSRYIGKRGYRILQPHFLLTRRYPSIVDFEAFNYFFAAEFFYKKFIKMGFRFRSGNIILSVLRYLKPYSRFHLIRFIEQFLVEGFPLYFEMSSLKQSNREQPFPVPINLRYFRFFMLKNLVTRFRAKRHKISAQAALLTELWAWHLDPTLSLLHDFFLQQYALGMDSRFFVHYRWRVKR